MWHENSRGQRGQRTAHASEDSRRDTRFASVARGQQDNEDTGFRAQPETAAVLFPKRDPN